MSALSPRVLVVDDEPSVRRATGRVLEHAGFAVTTAEDGDEALEIIRRELNFDLVVTDLQMPRMGGIEFLRAVRGINLDLPVVVLTGNPTLETAIEAVQYGAFRYLQKPVAVNELAKTARDASSLHRLALLKRRAIELYETEGWLIGDRAGLDSHFDRALRGIWIAFQPIISWPSREVYGHEALVRSDEATLATPTLLFEAAERLGRVRELGTVIRAAVGAALAETPGERPVFMNVHAADLGDADLFSAHAPLSKYASRVVLEITERRPLDRIDDVRGKMRQLRALGFRIAVDDLGSGYAGLASFGQLEPDIAKLDMSLVRGIESSRNKSSIVRSMIAVCTHELGIRVVCEGVETDAERAALTSIGADLLQGYYFGRPLRGLPA